MCVLLAGCAGIEPPTPGKLLTHPLGTSPLHRGMSKDEVRGIWGEPDLVQEKGIAKSAGATPRQEWVYYSHASNLPINYANLSKAMRIYFDGNSVTDFKEE